MENDDDVSDAVYELEGLCDNFTAHIMPYMSDAEYREVVRAWIKEISILSTSITARLARMESK